MARRNIVVIGASAGGIDALRPVLAGLPKDFDATILIVWHMAPGVHGMLPQILNKFSSLPVVNAVDRTTIETGRVYVAPPDRHLLLMGQRLRVTRGPRENGFRPAVDPLFRSAARSFGPRVIGIVLSGALDDGTAGLWTIKRLGGISIVQHPDEAQVSSMPEKAIESVRIDYMLRAAEMPELLKRLIHDEVTDLPVPRDRRTEIEVNVAMQNSLESMDILKQGEVSPFTCPECHGVLVGLEEGGRSRFRCHTGHAFSADSLLAHLSQNTEAQLWTILRTLQETILLLNHIGDHYAEINKPKAAAMFFRKAKETEGRADIIRRTLTQNEQLSPDKLQFQATEVESAQAHVTNVREE
jgi:two-component system chemotaxis response regulator CheB